MSAHIHRLENLRRSFEQFKKAELAKGNGTRGCGQRFASNLGISPKLLSNLLHEQKPIGTALARRFERSLNQEAGQFDQPANAVKAESEQEAIFLRTAMNAFRMGSGTDRQQLLENMQRALQQR